MTVEQLKLENETLTARLEKAKEVFRQQAADIKAKDAAYLKLRDEYNEVVRERDIHLEANSKFNNQVLELEKKNQSISDMYNKTVEGLKIRDNEINTLKEQLANNGYDREAYVGEIDALNDKIRELESNSSNNDSLQEELNTTKKELYLANEKLSEYDSKCKRYDEVIKSLNEKNDELEALATSRLTDINKSKEEIKKLNDTILEMNKNIETLDETHCKDYNALVLRYDDLQKEYNLLNTQFTDLENEYNNSEELRKSYTEATNKLNDEVARLQDIINSKDKAYKNLESTYKDLAEEHLRDIRALDYKVKMLETEVTNKTEKLNNAYEEIGTLKNRLNAESSKIEEVKAKTEVAVTTIKNKLQSLNDNLISEFNIFE